MLGSRPLDRDLAGQDGSGLDLIWRVDPRSGGPGQRGAGAAAQSAGAELRGGELAGAGRSAATWARLGRGLVQKDELGMGSPLGYLGRWCGIGNLALDGEGGSAAHRREISHGAGTDRGKRRHGEIRYRGVKLWDHLAGEVRRRRAGAGAAELRVWRGYGGARGEGRRRGSPGF
jgi:hypothetical protein